ncbi:MAG TPA: PhoX family phosphatase [Chthoniobacteraceae bacterium]|nr:PhoX family phosphatase [Chthoniobacteraceae bacterium]
MSFQDAITEQAMRGINDAPNDTLRDVFKRRYSRREMLRGSIAAASTLVLGMKLGTYDAGAKPKPTELAFEPISLSKEDAILLPKGYDYQVLLRWGDSIFAGRPDLNLAHQTAATQSAQFGYNCDFNGYFPLQKGTRTQPERAILCTNHEYTDETLMFPGYITGAPTRDQVDAGLAAHGMSFVEIALRDDEWQVIKSSRYNRRLTGDTLMEVTGPARGNAQMRTTEDPNGTVVRGTLNNCAGGKTPWGTVLTCEENFNQYFANRSSMPAGPARDAHTRYGLTTGASARRWELHHDRFDLAKEPNEAFRFGWVVEIDPYNPKSTPKKRTALGRFKHEGATCVVAPGGQVVVYSGDDERFDYVYKFVSAGRYDPSNREANLDLLDEGTLYVAKFNDDGSGAWLPLIFGYGPLTPANGFENQGDIVINTRRAGDLLGATKMDRPEDIEANPVTGKVYSLMTNNTSRGVGSNPGTNAANPRVNNRWGHVIEQTESGNDHAATTFTWEIFILCGDPADPTYETYYGGFDQSLVSPLAAPDNLVFDEQGVCWIATDGLQNALVGNDGIFAVPTEGPERGHIRQFMSCPLEGEICGPEFNPDHTSLFVGIQHPGEGGTFANPRSTWPDGPGHLPRPSVIVVQKTTPGVKTIGT